MGGISKHIGGAIGAIKPAATVTRGMNLSPAIQAALDSIAESGDQRAAFNAILLASVTNVAKKPHFNLELEINDLFVRLGNLRGMGAAPGTNPLKGIGAALGNISSMLGPVESALQALARDTKK